jgi:hypothetical protein
MSINSGRRFIAIAMVFGSLILAAATPAAAQREYEPLFDKFNVRLEGSWIALNTEIRLDSETLGRAPPSISRTTSAFRAVRRSPPSPSNGRSPENTGSGCASKTSSETRRLRR